MNLFKIKIVLLFILLSIIQKGWSQFYFLEDAHDQLELSFLKKKIETETNSSFFNLLKINNPSNQTVTFQTNFSYPSDWSFMGEKSMQITLKPNDSIYIPFRAATSIYAKGEIGYTIVASLADLKGNTLKNEYSFVNIPKIKNIKISPLERVVYFSKNQTKTSVELFISNNGNTDEIFYIDLLFDNFITTEKSSNNVYKDEITLQPYKDTLLNIPIFLIKNNLDQEKKFHRINLKTSTKDTLVQTSIWARELEPKFENVIADNYTMFSVELTAMNLFSEFEPNYSLNTHGNFLFKKIGSIYYSIQTYGSEFFKDPYEYGRYLFRYQNKGYKLEIGDVSGPFIQDVYGKGAYLEWNLFKQNSIKALYTQSTYTDKLNLGLSYSYLAPKYSIEGGTSYSINNRSRVKSTAYYIRNKFDSKKFGAISLGVSTTIAEWNVTQPKRDIGFGGDLRYNFDGKKIKYVFNSRFGQRNYFGRYNGKTEIQTFLNYTLTNSKYVRLAYTMTNEEPQKYIGDELVPSVKNIYSETSLTYNINLNPKTFLILGPYSESRFGNTFIGYDPKISLNTTNLLGYVYVRLKNSIKQNYFVFYTKAGYNFAHHYSKEVFNNDYINKNWFSAVLNMNYRTPNWGFYTTYYHGPYTIAQQFYFFNNNYFRKSVRIMPYLDMFLLPKYLQFIFRPNFTYDISSKTSRLNASTELIAYLKGYWQLSLLNSYSYSATTDNITLEKFTYNSAYFEFKLKKDFNIDQLRYQYHKLKIIFFKDLNGNLVKDANEPGINNILCSIEMDQSIEKKDEYSTIGYFMPMDLLSDYEGIIDYENIPNGYYTISYNLVGTIEGAYSSESNSQSLYIDENKTLYVPFTENNKIFGKVVLNRSKLSNLGLIDPSNIKVTAEDTYGKKFSSLTDANGNFSIFVPNVDKYKVHINNIFYENFELEQNDYEVQLNGYRQFEVNFIFNEKKRKINFTASYDYGSRLDGPGVEIVRRTNLTGTVKDATTLQPIVANVKVIDNQGNEVTNASSSVKTGIFTASFIAGDDYTVEVTSDDYWFYAEKLYSQQIVTFANLKKEILLKAITVGALIPMNTLNFESGKTEIPATSFPELERLLKVLKKNPSVKIAVHGHADDLEIQGVQEDLATERAKIVAKYLIANGYNRVTYLGHSNTKPIAENDTEDGRRMNRRVEIVVTGK